MYIVYRFSIIPEVKHLSVSLSSQPSVLTLKNIYRVLTQKNYPSVSYPVFPEESLQGQTLVKFWYELFREVFPDTIDLSIFDASEKRSRTQSRLLNRSGAAGMLGGWYAQISSVLDYQLLLHMAEVWMNRMEQWHYNPQALNARIQLLIREIMEKQDVDEELSVFFQGMEENTTRSGGRASACSIPLLFRHGVLLSFLTLYALYGNRMQDAALNRLRIRNDVSFPALYRHYLNEKEAVKPNVISTRQCTLCVQPLSPHAYFGHSTLFAQADQYLRETGKLIVQGMGGIGKTEFVRQFLSRLIDQHRYGQLAFVQYEEDLETSFVHAFPFLKQAQENRLELVQKKLETESDRKTLLLIDNVDVPPSADPALNALSMYGCDVIITTRTAELDGFSVLHLNGLDETARRQLFAHHYRRSFLPEEVDTICSLVAGHPLAIVLFANLCRTRFWAPEKLIERLKTGGLSSLSYVRQASTINLADIFSHMFSLSSLEKTQARLMSLFALLPYQYWMPETLAAYAGDIETDPDRLADLCQTLCDLGWLMSGDAGFAVHPLIGETVRLTPVSADDFPFLWQYLNAAACGPDALANRVLVSAIAHTDRLNLYAVRLLARLEHCVSFISFVHLPQAFYDIHLQFLREHPHEPSDESDYWLALGIRDIVLNSLRDRLNEYLAKIEPLISDSPDPGQRRLLYSLLEYASANSDLTVVNRVFTALRPDDPHSPAMADYLISYSVKQRRGDHDPSAALESLTQADRILKSAGLNKSLEQSNLDYRRATCLMDMGRSNEARPLLENCLDILSLLKYPTDAAKVMSTRSTYAVALNNVGEYDAALKEYLELAELYRQQERTHCAEYAMMRNNTAVLLLSMERFSEAEKVILEVLALDEELKMTPDIVATHNRNAALILAHCKKWAEARRLAEKAIAMRTELYGEASPWTADARAVCAFVLAHTGCAEQARLMIAQSRIILEKEWGPVHRHSINARTIQEAIDRELNR